MKLGIVFPQTEIGAAPIVIRDFTQASEALGFDYFLAYDHILGANPAAYPDQKFIYTHDSMFHEPLILFSYLAALTQKIEFVTGILVLPQRNAALVAKQAVQLSLMSGGRFRLGVGAGWNKAEMEAIGDEFGNRGKRMDEQIQVIQALFTDRLVQFSGQYHTLRDVGLNPMPPHHIPLWFGGYADSVLERAAKFGDGWMPATFPDDELPLAIAKVKALVTQAGRDAASFGIDAQLALTRHPRDRWPALLESWSQMGVSHLRLTSLYMNYTPAQHLKAMEDFMTVAKAFQS